MTRKIEQQMNAAIQTEKDWKNSNTQVINNEGVSEVFLHNNLIARVGDTFLQIFDGGWQSNTTKSRLNAILSVHGAGGECVFQKNFEWFFSDANGDVIPFENGMILS
jgi:hypothetical protein